MTYGPNLSNIQGESAKYIAMPPLSQKGLVARNCSQFASKARIDHHAQDCTRLDHHARGAKKWYTRIDGGCKDNANATSVKAPLALEDKVQHKFHHHAMPHLDEVATSVDTTS
jgi:hypothetical protein